MGKRSGSEAAALGWSGISLMSSAKPAKPTSADETELRLALRSAQTARAATMFWFYARMEEIKAPFVSDYEQGCAWKQHLDEVVYAGLDATYNLLMAEEEAAVGSEAEGRVFPFDAVGGEERAGFLRGQLARVEVGQGLPGAGHGHIEQAPLFQGVVVRERHLEFAHSHQQHVFPFPARGGVDGSEGQAVVLSPGFGDVREAKGVMVFV